MPSVRMFSDELDLGDDLRTSGPQLGAELLERIAPSNPLEYVQENLLGRNGEGAKIAEAVARAGGPKKTSVQRTLERYATGERAKGGLGPKQAKTLEAYQQKYELATGKRSEVLQTLIDVASGKRVTGQLPKGTLTIQIMAAIDAYAGSHDPRANTPRPVTLDIPPARTARAFADPMAEWVRAFEETLPDIIINQVDWIEMTFTPKG